MDFGLELGESLKGVKYWSSTTGWAGSRLASPNTRPRPSQSDGAIVLESGAALMSHTPEKRSAQGSWWANKPPKSRHQDWGGRAAKGNNILSNIHGRAQEKSTAERLGPFPTFGNFNDVCNIRSEAPFGHGPDVSSTIFLIVCNIILIIFLCNIMLLVLESCFEGKLQDSNNHFLFFWQI